MKNKVTTRKNNMTEETKEVQEETQATQDEGTTQTDHEIYVVVAKYKMVNGGQMSFPARDEKEAESLARAMLSDHEDVEIVKVIAANRIAEVVGDEENMTEEEDGQVVIDPDKLN